MMTTASEADFTFDNGVITGYTGAGGDVVIPATINGQQVNRIGDWSFSNQTTLTSVIIPSTVTSIGGWAFAYCYGLQSIDIPDTVTSLGAAAFDGCGELKSVTLPQGLTSIQDWTLQGCSSLTSIVIPEGVTSIGDSAFSSCSALTSITLPSSLQAIAQNPFVSCHSLSTVDISGSNTAFVVDAGVIYDIGKTRVIAALPAIVSSVYLPDSVTLIASNAFRNCSDLSHITLPEGLAEIGESAFQGCDALTALELPESILSIGEFAFAGCASLKSIVFPRSVTSIGKGALSACSSLTEIAIQDGNEFYAASEGVLYTTDHQLLVAFPAGRFGVASIPYGVASIGAYAFSGCGYLVSLSIPDSVRAIGEFAFHTCGSLVHIDLGLGVETIADGAFANCYSLSSLVLPRSLKAVASRAFENCRSIAALVFAGDHPSGFPRFFGANPHAVIYYASSANGWQNASANRDIRPLDQDMHAVELSRNGNVGLWQSLDYALIVKVGEFSEPIAIMHDGESVAPLLSGRWHVGEAAVLNDRNILFARDAFSGLTHRIYVSSSWSAESLFHSVGNAFSVFLPHSARGLGDTGESEPPVLAVGAHVPIDLGGFIRLYRSYAGGLFVGTTDSSTGKTAILLTDSSQSGYRPVAADVGWGSGTGNLVLFGSSSGSYALWSLDEDWGNAVLVNDGSDLTDIDIVRLEIVFLVGIDRQPLNRWGATPIKPPLGGGGSGPPLAPLPKPPSSG